MASNFKIFVHANSENIHLKLTGDFDGSSAHELLNTLKKYCRRTSGTYIHTSCLRQIHPFGLEVLKSNLDVLQGKCTPLVFTGDNAHQLAPDGSRFL
jgi:anti-anti-sigma regulatory factor